MLVLGTTADDKGTQLEELTKTVLERLEYSEVVRSDIRAGGAEIDISGVRITPLPAGRADRQRLLCECKAHQNPQNMSDWMKFLGKVYVEESTKNSHVLGCFIALSGVNGNVWGSYDEYRKHKTNITLLQESDILEMARELYPLSTTEQANRTIQGFTSRPIRRLEVAYYQHTLYWVVFFDDGTYALLTGQGTNLPAAQAAVIGPLVESNSAAQQRLDLQAEAEAQMIQTVLRKKFLAAVASHGGHLPVNITAANNAKYTDSPEGKEAAEATNQPVESTPVVANDGNHVLQSLEKDGWIQVELERGCIGFQIDGKSRSAFFAELSLFILKPPTDLETILTYIESDFYVQHIDEELVEYIQAVQGALPLSPEQKATIIQFLRMTPSGLLSAIQPIEMIVNHRIEQPGVLDAPNVDMVDKRDVAILLHRIYDGLMTDFLSQRLSKHYHVHRRLRALSHTQEIVLRTNDGDESEEFVIARASLRNDYAIGQMDEEFGGGYHVMLKL